MRGASFRGGSGCSSTVLLRSNVGQLSAFQAPHLHAVIFVTAGSATLQSHVIKHARSRLAAPIAQPAQRRQAAVPKFFGACSACWPVHSLNHGLHAAHCGCINHQCLCCIRSARSRQAHLFSRFRMQRMAEANCFPYLGSPSSSAYSCPSSSSASTTWAKAIEIIRWREVDPGWRDLHCHHTA